MAEGVDTRFEPLLDDEDNEAESFHFKPERKRPVRAWWIALSLILVVLLVAGIYYWQQRSKTPVTYNTADATIGNLSTTISATGPISARAAYSLNFPNSGQISEIDVKVGQKVTQGQTLAKLYINNDPTRVATLTAPAAATVGSINGVVGGNSGSSSSGNGGGASTSSSSSSSSSTFMTLVDLSSLNITAQVNETDVANVKVGQPAQFTVASYPSATFRGSVSSVDLIGQSSSNVVTFPVHLTVDTNSLNNNALYPGMTATVNITTAQRIGSLLIPASAITFTSTALQAGEINRSDITALTGGASAQGSGNSSTSTATAGSNRVVLTLNNGKLKPIMIKTGLNSGQSVEVLSGLQEGSQVVVSQTGGSVSTTNSRNGTNGNFGGGNFGGGGGLGGGTRRTTGGGQ